MKTHPACLAMLLALATPAAAGVVINELMSSNGSTIADEDGGFEDWIELHNPTAEPIDLGGWGLSDNAGSPFKWIFAPQTVIAPGGHLLVWASAKDRNGNEDAPPPPVATAPDALPGLVAWFRADALTASDDDTVESWTDSSGAGNHATQPDPARRPRMQTEAINGLPALAFGGEREFSLPQAGFSGMENLENFTFVAVARWDGGVSSGLWGTGPSNATSGNLHFEINSGGALRLRVAGMAGIQVPGAVATGWNTLAATQDSVFEDPLARVLVNGQVVGSRSEEVGESALTEYGGFFLGNSHNSARNFDGLIAEVVLFNRALDATELASLQNHFEAKYQLAAPPPALPGVPLHTNFRISAEGEPLSLTRPDGSTADFIPAVAVPRDTSYGRQPDGAADFHHFLEATPGAANTSQPYTAPVPQPDFSVPRGFHEDAFTLTLSHPDPEVEILFTTDGGVPAPGAAAVFTTPIPIGSTSVIRAYAHKPGALPTSRMVTHSYLFPDDILQQRDDPDALGFPHAWGSWSATHYGFEPAVSEAPAYAPLMKQALGDIPTLSLVMEMDDLFDPATGIYASRSFSGGAPRGEAWERPVSVEILHPDGTRADFHINAGIRVQGGASRRADRTPKSSLRLLFKNIYDTGTLQYPLLGEHDGVATEFNSIVLRAGYNNEWLHGFDSNQRRRGQYVRDQFIRNSQLAANGHASRGNHVHLYLNGVYWGLYNPSERADAAFGATYFGGEREDWDAITHRGIRDGNQVAWNTLNSRANADLAVPGNYQAVLEYLDLPQYIDYMIVNLWAGMQDWPNNNWNAIRRREDGHGFMFFCWDAERSMEGLNDNRTGVSADAARFYQRMRANPEFRLAFADRVHQHFFNNGALTPAQTVARYQAAARVVEHAVIAESARWGSFRRDKGTAGGSESEIFTRNIHWQAEHDRLVNTYLPQRSAIVLQQFRNANLYPSITAPAFDQHGGELAPGEPLTITAPAGTIFHTLDGADPREPSALVYTGPIILRSGTTTVRARTFHNGQWSALLEADFTVEDTRPERIDLVEGAGVATFDPTWWFDPPVTDPGFLIATTGNPAVATAEIDGNGNLVVTGLSRGGCGLIVTHDDGENPPQQFEVPVLVQPSAHVLAIADYSFDAWEASNPAGAFPPHMIFLQGQENDSSLATELLQAYHIPENDAAASADVDLPYAATSRTRINGLGAGGIAFINTGRGRDLGGALLALDTTGLDAARVGFTAGTVLPNTRIYAIRLQYRVGHAGPFLDLTDDEGLIVEYVRNATAGHEEVLGPIDLPGTLLGQPYVQLLWRYHRLGGTSGPRAQLRLDDVRVTNQAGGTPAGFVFDPAPAGIQSGTPLPPVVVRVVDEGGFATADFDGPVTLSLAGDGGQLSGIMTAEAVDGVAVFDDLAFTGAGLFQLTASATGLAPATSDAIRSLALTTLILPQFIQGEQDAGGDNTDRVPFAWHARIDGLAPHAIYRFANRVVLSEDGPASDGAGNMIFATSTTEHWIRTTESPRFREADLGTRHFTLTAGPDGTFTGWFLTEPSGNARFTPGNTLHFRLLLNDGNDGEQTHHILTTAESAQAIRFGTAPGEGTAIIGISPTAARHIALLHSDADGTARPLAATPVEITGAGTDERYAAFYHNIVATNQSHWGTILPNDLPGGLRRVEIRAADATAALLDTRTTASGFPGTINSAGGLNVPILLGMPPTTYAQWRTLHFPDPADRADDSISGPAATDATGTANLIRYAFNLDLDAIPGPSMPRINPVNNTFRFALDLAKTDLAWIVRSSPDLHDWTSILFDSRIDTPPPADPSDPAGLTPIPYPTDHNSLFLSLELLLID